jgi:hypothetical protein
MSGRMFIEKSDQSGEIAPHLAIVAFLSILKHHEWAFGL